MNNEYFELVDLNGQRLNIDENLEKILILATGQNTITFYTEPLRLEVTTDDATVIFAYNFNSLYNDENFNKILNTFDLNKIITEFLTKTPVHNVFYLLLNADGYILEFLEQKITPINESQKVIELDFDDYCELIDPSEYKNLLEDYEILQTLLGSASESINIDALLDLIVERYTIAYNQFK